MAPPTPTFHVSTLQSQLNTLPDGKSRKPPIKLSDCAPKEMVQYKCNITVPKEKGEKPLIFCEPVVRFYRQCANGLMVETTSWEGWNDEEKKAQGSSAER